MKKQIFVFTTLFSLTSASFAADLMQVYQEALFCDPVYQQAIAQRLSDKEATPLALSALLPQANISGGPSIGKFRQSGSPLLPAFSTTMRGYSFTLSLSQTVFNYSQFKALSEAKAVSCAADAMLNAESQNLMLRVAQAYFAVLKDEENLIYNRANKRAYAQQYDQINEQYKVGIKTVTDVYTAKASYDLASAGYIAAQTLLANDKENLRAITGNYYAELASLSSGFPLISPQPADMEAWVRTALRQNWSIKAAQLNSIAARENIKEQFGGHLPTVSLQGAYNVAYNNNLNDNNPSTVGLGFPLQAHSTNASVMLNFGVPILQGGAVVAQTNRARYGYQAALQRLEQTTRSTVNTTRQSFMSIMAGIQQIKADQQAVKSTISSLRGLQAGYRVGTQTLVDVLNQQQRVFQAETQYATDRFAYINNLLLLKQAAGTLSVEDLIALNCWLVDKNEKKYKTLPIREAKIIRKNIAVTKNKNQINLNEKTNPIVLAKLDKTDYSLSP